MEDTIILDGVEYLRAHPVAAGRCRACGASPRLWKPGEITAAIRRHVELFGGVPSREKWGTATAEHPEFQVAHRVFGSWGNAIRAAGFEPLGVGSSLYWTRERIVEAMHDYFRRTGRRPTVAGWNSATPEHPAATQVKQRFGTFNEALEVAGFYMYGPFGARLTSKKAIRRAHALANRRRAEVAA